MQHKCLRPCNTGRRPLASYQLCVGNLAPQVSDADLYTAFRSGLGLVVNRMYSQLEPRALGRSFSGEVLGARVVHLAAVVRRVQSCPFAGVQCMSANSLNASFDV